MATAYVGMGSNLDDRARTLVAGVQRLETLGQITAVSSLYETDPVGYLEQPAFLNAVAALDTTLTPQDFLRALLSIERDLGRTRTFANGPRTLDLDLLLVDDEIRITEELSLPHPRLHERGFVLVPLAEIAPEVNHPILNRSASELLQEVTDHGVTMYASRGWEAAMA